MGMQASKSNGGADDGGASHGDPRGGRTGGNISLGREARDKESKTRSSLASKAAPAASGDTSVPGKGPCPGRLAVAAGAATASLSLGLLLTVGAGIALVRLIKKGHKHVRFTKSEQWQVFLVEQEPTLKGTGRLYIRLPPGWVDAGILGQVIGRMWRDIPTKKISTSAGDLYVAEVVVANEPDDDTKPFFEFMVTNKRGMWDKPNTGAKNYILQWPGRYLLEGGEVRELLHGPDENEGGIVFAEPPPPPPETIQSNQLPSDLPEPNGAPETSAGSVLQDSLASPPALARKTSLLTLGLKPAIKSPGRCQSPVGGLSPSASSHAIFQAASAAVAAAESARLKIEALDMDAIRGADSDEEEWDGMSRFKSCGTPPKRNPNAVSAWGTPGKPPRPAAAAASVATSQHNTSSGGSPRTSAPSGGGGSGSTTTSASATTSHRATNGLPPPSPLAPPLPLQQPPTAPTAAQPLPIAATAPTAPTAAIDGFGSSTTAANLGGRAVAGEGAGEGEGGGGEGGGEGKGGGGEAVQPFGSLMQHHA